MADVKNTGINGLILDIDEIAEIPPEVKADILEAETQIGLESMKKQLRAQKLVDTSQLLNSLSIKRNEQKFKWTIYPKGRRKHAKPRKLRKYKKGKFTGYKTGKMTNNDVGFVLELGAPRRHIPAYQWMRIALEESDEKSTKAAAAVHDKWLRSKNL